MIEDTEHRLQLLEDFKESHDAMQTQIVSALATLTERLDLYIGANGGITVTVRDKRLRFAGSMSMPTAALSGVASVATLVILVGRAFGVW